MVQWSGVPCTHTSLLVDQGVLNVNQPSSVTSTRGLKKSPSSYEMPLQAIELANRGVGRMPYCDYARVGQYKTIDRLLQLLGRDNSTGLNTFLFNFVTAYLFIWDRRLCLALKSHLKLLCLQEFLL